MRTPPGVSRGIFASALQEFAGVVGSDWVFTSDADLDLYRDAFSPLRGTPEERIASAAVAPSTVEEVQAIVRIANRHGIPLYTISTGKNLGYYNNNILRRFHESVKDAVDPKGILSPGRYGIWPKHLREKTQ